MFAWISRYNGKEPELGTTNNTTYSGSLKQIMKYGAKYSKGFEYCQVSIHHNEDNRYGKPDDVVTFVPQSF